MKPIHFKQANVVWAEHQPPFLPLPAYTDEDETITCWALTWRERLRVLFSGLLWLRQMNYRKPLQAQSPTTVDPWSTQTLRELARKGING